MSVSKFLNWSQPVVTSNWVHDVLYLQQLQKQHGRCVLQWAVLLWKNPNQCKHLVSWLIEKLFQLLCCTFSVGRISLLTYNFTPEGLQRKSVWPHHQCFAEEGKTRLRMASPAEGWSQGKCVLIVCLKPSVHIVNIGHEELLPDRFTMVDNLEYMLVIPCSPVGLM